MNIVPRLIKNLHLATGVVVNPPGSPPTNMWQTVFKVGRGVTKVSYTFTSMSIQGTEVGNLDIDVRGRCYLCLWGRELLTILAKLYVHENYQNAFERMVFKLTRYEHSVSRIARPLAVGGVASPLRHHSMMLP